MTIELIEQAEYQKLLDIQKSNPKLTFQNDGYQYIGRNTLEEDDKNKLSEAEEVLRKVIKGFKEFNNFKLSEKTEEIRIRFRYDYMADWKADNEFSRKPSPFTGVGYLYLDELLNGFRNNN